MDTKVIATRLQKLESYVQHLHDLKHAALDEYLDDENLILVHDYLDIDSEIVYTHLAGEISDFEQFAQEISAAFLS